MNRGSIAFVVSVTFTALSGVVLVARCVSRFVIARQVGFHDVLSIPAWLASVAVTCLIYGQYEYGLGQDIDQVSFDDLTMVLKYMWASILAYSASMSFLKLSAVSLYLSLPFGRIMHFFSWALVANFALGGVGAILIGIYSCQPIAYSWDKSIPDGKCINSIAWWYAASIWVIITDIIIVTMPIFIFKNLNMPLGQKRALIAVFALGGLGCVVSIVNVFWIDPVLNSTNLTQDYSTAALLSSIEINIGIICISIPQTKALVIAISKLLSRNRKPSSKDSVLPSSAIQDLQVSSLSTSTTIASGKIPDPWAIP